jgi:signal peptidase II
MSLSKKAVLLILLVLIVDQVFKIIIKVHFKLGESVPVFDNWFLIRFIENPGMAFGIDIPGKLGKPVLSIFRIIAVILIGWYLVTLIRKNAPTGFVLCIALIFAGAIGNIIDSMFYGLIFSESTYFETAKFLPAGGGYASFLHGHVVDMLYFPVIECNYPSWFPIWGGERFVFFRPIFNIADSAISIGVTLILIFQRKYLKEMN